MDFKEKKILEILDLALRDHQIKERIDTIVEHVDHVLKNDQNAIMAWEPIPLDLYQQQLPDEIKSSWVFILRKNVTTGAERHPNSIQRMMSYKGRGDFQTKPNLKWNSNFLENNAEVEIEKRWISIPQNIWHQGIVGDENWVVVSFHTVEASSLIEERLEAGSENKLIRKKYIDSVTE